MRSFSRVSLVLATVTFAMTGHAIDLPVTYLADFKEFRRNAIAGDSLSFDLYTDDACTGVVAHAELKFVGGSGLTVEKTLPQKAKGQKPSPTKGVRLHTTLSPAAVAEQLYLKVTGTGVVALGDECQVQVAGIPGPEGPKGDPGPLLDVAARVYSANDITVARFSSQALSFPEERWDTAALHDPAQPSRIVIPASGNYLIYANLAWSAADLFGTERFVMQFRVNGSQITASQTNNADGLPLNPTHSLSTAALLVAGDYLEVVVEHSAPSNRRIVALPDYSPDFGIVRLP